MYLMYLFKACAVKLVVTLIVLLWKHTDQLKNDFFADKCFVKNSSNKYPFLGPVGPVNPGFPGIPMKEWAGIQSSRLVESTHRWN